MTSLFLSVPIFVLLLLAVVGAVVLLYLLRPPVLNRLISSNLIWKRVLGTSRAISERWRWWLSLLLALLITTCLFFSALRPSIDGQADNRVLIILDNSPSMGDLTQSGATRYDIAKIAVSKLLDSFSKDVEVMLSIRSAKSLHLILTPSRKIREDLKNLPSGPISSLLFRLM